MYYFKYSDPQGKSWVNRSKTMHIEISLPLLATAGTKVPNATHNVERQQEKRKEIWCNMTNTLKRQTMHIVNVTQRRYKTFDYTTITDRLRTVSWSDNIHLTGLVNLGFKGRTCSLPATIVKSNGQNKMQWPWIGDFCFKIQLKDNVFLLDFAINIVFLELPKQIINKERKEMLSVLKISDIAFFLFQTCTIWMINHTKSNLAIEDKRGDPSVVF